jgi:hypothetical protein
MSRKKDLEIAYIEEARRASTIFPSGNLVPHEIPDALLHSDGETIGIEETGLCEEDPRAEAGRLSKIPDKAKAAYGRMADAPNINVSAVFSRDAANLGVNELVTSLAQFVHLNRHRRGSDFDDIAELPKGYSRVGVHEPNTQDGHWYALRAYGVGFNVKDLIESRIAEKNQRVPDYRLAAPKVWLLITNDQFPGPGQVFVSPEQLAEWKFDFVFDKVLLFLRQAGGTGDVIELHQA